MTKTATTKTREDWLNKASVKIARIIKSETGLVIPATRVSIGFPFRSRGNTIGQCWAGSAVKDGKPAIFIAPTLTDPKRILDVLTHELIHAALPESGHTGEFSKTAKAVGLVAPWTATTASPELAARLAKMSKTLGRFGHSPIGYGAAKAGPKGTPKTGPEAEPKVVGKQTTRMLKVECPEDGYTARVSRKWLAVGCPTCPCGTEMEEA